MKLILKYRSKNHPMHLIQYWINRSFRKELVRCSVCWSKEFVYCDFNGLSCCFCFSMQLDFSLFNWD